MRVERGRSAGAECASRPYPPCLLCATEAINIGIYGFSKRKAGDQAVQELSCTEAKAVLGKSFLGTWLLHQHGRDERRPDQALREVSGRARKASRAKPPGLPLLELFLKSTTFGGGRLITTLRQLHDELDNAVVSAYGLAAKLGVQDTLEHLVKLNVIRAAEERAGRTRYLRPEYQNPAAAVQGTIGIEAPVIPVPSGGLLPFPQTLAEQARVVRQMLSGSARPLSTAEIARSFARAQNERIEDITLLLVELGQARQVDTGTLAYAA